MTRRDLLFLTILGTVIVDAISIALAEFACFLLVFEKTSLRINPRSYIMLASFFILSRLAGFYIFRFYTGVKNKTAYENFVNSIKACTLSSAVIVTVLYFGNIGIYTRSNIILSFTLTVFIVNIWRLIVKKILKISFGRDYFFSRVLVIGTGKDAKEAALKSIMDASANYMLIGFIGTGSKKTVEIEKEKILGTMDELPFLIKKYLVDEVIIAAEDIDKEKLLNLMSISSWENISLKAAPPAYETVIGNMVLCESGAPFLGPTFSSRPPPSWYWGLKRIVDIIFSLLLLTVTLPLSLLTMVLIKVTSPGPIFYLQKRTGLNGKPFIMYKFRTMRVNAERGKQPRWAKKDDVRITPIGRFLRHFRIDELPQLLNVLKNEMSLIGPRPERPYFTSQLLRKVPFYAQRLHVKPGLTGWAQVSYRYTDTEKGAQDKLLYDLFYTHNASLSLDLLIILKTFRVVLTGHGAH